MSWTIRRAKDATPAHIRYGKVLGWCYAMRWIYGVNSWSRESKAVLESVIKRLERSAPGVFDVVVTIKGVGARQRKFLEWACEYLDIKPLTAKQAAALQGSHQ